jgi:putative ABC transport system permease protein
MAWRRQIAKFRCLFGRGRRARELREELCAHLGMEEQENLETGMSPEEAHYSALRRFGNVTIAQERSREMWGWNSLETLLQDVRYGLRQLRRSPGFTAVAVLTLALGIGANTAIFSVVNAVMLRPLPFQDPERLVRVVSIRLQDKAGDNASYPDFLDWRSQNHVFDRMGVFRTEGFTLTGRGQATHLQGSIVSAEMFSLLAVKPLLGRTFLPEEDTPGTTNGGDAVILSHRLWRERFGAETGVVGQTIQLDNKSATIVGVMPEGFQFPMRAGHIDLWATIARDSENGEKSMAVQRGAHYLDVMARLKPGVTIAQAEAEMGAIISGLNKQYPENSPRGARIVPELDQMVGDVRPALLVLLGAVGCVLLIACANVANLLLARATSRQREMAIRAALGASKGRMIRQVLSESLVLASAGGALGALLAFWVTDFLVRLIPADIPRLSAIHLDSRVLVFTIALSLVTGLLFGMAPALQVSTSSLSESLKESGRGATEGIHRHRVRSTLVVAEVAVAAMLLVGAGLLIRSFARLERVDPGFNPHQVLTFKVELPGSRYSMARMVDLFRQIATRLNQLPGVRSASALFPFTLNGDEADTTFDIEGRSVAEADRPRTAYIWVEPGFFRTLGIPILSGRDFTAQDDLKTTPVIIINQTLARRFFPNENPVGKRISTGIGNGYKQPPMREIIGVVGDVKQEGLEADVAPAAYVAVAQSPFDVMTFVVRTGADPASVVAAARNEVAAVDKDLPIFDVKTLDQHVSESVAQPHFNTLLLGIFAGLALALAAVGLYGVIAYSVVQRTHEFGVRMALGAEQQDVLRMVLGQGIVLTLAGVGIGVAGALALTRFLGSLLFGIRPNDPATFAAVLLVMTVVALLASYVPARRATRVDPMVALRCE